jgi:hypothetical protein
MKEIDLFASTGRRYKVLALETKEVLEAEKLFKDYDVTQYATFLKDLENEIQRAKDLEKEIQRASEQESPPSKKERSR